MKKVIAILTVIVFLFCLCGCRNKNTEPPAVAETPENRIERHLRELTAKDMAGRRGGSRGEARAALYLAHQLQQAGLKPAGEAGTYMQSFSMGNYEPVLVDKRMTFRHAPGSNNSVSENILGMLPGIEDKVIIVSAHYDHLGVIKDKIYPGANDNASGAALVLELAAALSREMPRCNILFAFWGAEEMGLLGSAYFNAHPTVPLDKVLSVVNIDSVGNLRPDKKLLGWSTVQNETSKYIVEVLNNEGWEIDWQKTDKHSSDHASFSGAGISAFTLLSPHWLDDNHTPQDTVNKIKTGLLAELLFAIKKALVT